MVAENPIGVFEHAYYIGNFMSGILYGFELILYFQILRKLRKRKSGTAQARWYLAAFSTVSLILITIDISCNAVWGELMWIEGRELPGGVLQFFSTQVSAWYQTLGSTSIVALIFMGDAFLLYRLFVIWGSNLLILLVPSVAYLAAFGKSDNPVIPGALTLTGQKIALAIIQLVVAGKPGGDFFGGKSINFGTPYYAITIGLNIVVTILICVRLFFIDRALRKTAATNLPLKSCTNLTAISIESAALYSLFGIMFLVPYASGSQTSIAFGQVWAKLTCICPQMIVLRIAGGHAWSLEKEFQVQSTLKEGRDRESDGSSSQNGSLSRV